MADDILKYFSYFSHKQDLASHANCLCRLHEMSNPAYGKNKKNITNLSVIC